jgi:hypothetical protein
LLLVADLNQLLDFVFGFESVIVVEYKLDTADFVAASDEVVEIEIHLYVEFQLKYADFG